MDNALIKESLATRIAIGDLVLNKAINTIGLVCRTKHNNNDAVFYRDAIFIRWNDGTGYWHDRDALQRKMNMGSTIVLRKQKNE